MHTKTIITVFSVSLMALFCVAEPADRALVVSVVQDAGTKDIWISIENLTAVDQPYYDSFSKNRKTPRALWCQFAVRNDKGEIICESEKEFFDRRSGDVIVLPAPLSTLKSGQKVTKVIPHSALQDNVESMILSHDDGGVFNVVRFMACVERDSRLTEEVWGESEYVDLADYRLEATTGGEWE